MKNNRKPWTMRASADGTLEVMLYDEIGESFWGEGGTTAKQFDADLKAAGNVSRIKLRINSPGGDVWQGLAIFNTLRSHGAKITAQVDGIAASIASCILMAADVGGIGIAPTAVVMVHNPQTFVGGDYRDLEKMVETLGTVKASMITSYKRHSSLSTAKISALMDDESWMDAQTAVRDGFADEVIEEDDPEENGDEEDLAAILHTPIFARFKHAPPGLAAGLARRRPKTSRASSRTVSVPEETQASAGVLSVEQDRLRLHCELLKRLEE